MAKKLKKEARADFETLLARVETLVRELESGDIGIEDAMLRYEEGMRAVQACRKVLDDAERRIEILVRGEGSEWKTEDFEPAKAPAPKKARQKKTKAPEEEGMLF